MDIRQEVEIKELELAQLRDKLNQIEQLDKEKQDIQDSINSEKQNIDNARQQLSDAKANAIEKLRVKAKLDKRVAELKKEKEEYISQVDREIREVREESIDIDTQVGQQLQYLFYNLWKLENPYQPNQSVLRSTQGYNVDAIADKRNRDKQMYQSWDKYYISILKEVGVHG